MGAARSRANRRGRRPRRPAKLALPSPRLPSPGGGVKTPAGPDDGGSRRPSGVDHRAEQLACCVATPAGGSRQPSLRTEPLTGAHAHNPAVPGPYRAARPGTGCPRKPRSVSISPSVGRGAPTPPRPSAAANNNPCLPLGGRPLQGRMRGGSLLPPIPGQTVGGGVPDTPLALAPFRAATPKPSANGHPPGNHPQTSAHANPGPGMPGPYRVIIPLISTLLKRRLPHMQPPSCRSFPSLPSCSPPARPPYRHNPPTPQPPPPQRPPRYKPNRSVLPITARRRNLRPAAYPPNSPVGHLLTLPQNQNSGPVWNTGDALYEPRTPAA